VQVKARQPDRTSRRNAPRLGPAAAVALTLLSGCSDDFARVRVRNAADVALVVEGERKDIQMIPRGKHAPYDSPTIYVTSKGAQVWASREPAGLRMKSAVSREHPDPPEPGDLLLTADGRAWTQSVSVASDIHVTPRTDVVRQSDKVPAGQFAFNYDYVVEHSYDIDAGRSSTGLINLSVQVPKENVAGVWEVTRPNRTMGWVCFIGGLFLGSLGIGLTTAHSGSVGIPVIAFAATPLLVIGSYTAMRPETKTLLFSQADPRATAPQPAAPAPGSDVPH
jgi:hypothetical protein